MQSSELVSSFAEIARAKDIERDTLQLIVEDVIRAMINRRYGADEAFEIIFNPSQGDIQILHIREIVADWDLEDPVTQIELTDAKTFDEDFEIGDEVATELDIADFGRRAVMTARQTFRQSIRDIEKEQIFEEYSELVGEIVVGEVYQVRHREVLVMHDDVELVLPRREQIPADFYRKGDMLRAIVKEVRRDAGSDPQVIISRSDPVFMERLFELEVPEIYEGIVEIKKIARIPGDRAKVAVVSHDQRVDPVGACVGVKGVRIHAVVRELSNENIDVLPYAEDPQKLIQQALSPANPTKVRINDAVDPPRARAEVPSDEVSQAIGRGGVNIRLASQLTGYEIDVYRNIPADEEDIDIEEFGDELSDETIAALKTIGCDTGKAVLELSADELSRRSGLEREVSARVIEIIEAEFERGPREGGGVFEQPFTLEALGTTLEDPEAAGEEAEATTEEEAVAEEEGERAAAPSGTAATKDGETPAPAAPDEAPAPVAPGETAPQAESASGEAVGEPAPAKAAATDEERE